MNPAEIESHLVLLLIAWSVIIGAAWAVGRLGKKLGQPLAVGEIAAGILLGPSVLGLCGPWGAEAVEFLRNPELQKTLQLLGKLGLILLLFQVGMEFHFSNIKKQSRTVLYVAALGMIGPLLMGWMIGPWLHAQFAPEVPQTGMILFCGIAMAISALPIMGRILIEMNLKTRPFAILSITAAALDDVVGWVLLATAGALTTAWAKNQAFEAGPLLLQIGGIVAFYLLMMKVIGPLLRKLYRKLATDDDNLPHSFLAVLLVTLFLCCLVTHKLGIFTIFGAFLLGVSLHQERRLVDAWSARYSALVVVAFVPIFFTNNGLNVNLQSLNALGWMGLAVVCVCSVAGKLGCCYLGARLGGETHHDAFRIGTLLNTRALMGLIAVNVGKSLGLLNDTMFTMFVLMCLLTTAMCGPLLNWSLRKDTAEK
jgi:Kef-type K+ transport system membrane component KefB